MLRLPVLRDAVTGHAIKGTGQPLQNEPPVEFSRRRIREWMRDNVEDFLEAARTGAIEKGDPRWAKILLEHGVSKPVEVRDNREDPRTARLFELLSQSHPSIEVMDPDSYTVDGEARDVTEG